jgi:hypothetical protein
MTCTHCNNDDDRLLEVILVVKTDMFIETTYLCSVCSKKCKKRVEVLK